MVVFTGSHPDHTGVVWVDDHTANGVNAIVVKNRLERGSVVDGFPDMA